MYCQVAGGEILRETDHVSWGDWRQETTDRTFVTLAPDWTAGKGCWHVRKSQSKVFTGDKELT